MLKYLLMILGLGLCGSASALTFFSPRSFADCSTAIRLPAPTPGH